MNFSQPRKGINFLLNLVNQLHTFTTILYWQFTFLLWSPSQAYALEPEFPDVGPYAALENSTVEKLTFGWDETPAIYTKWNIDELNASQPLHQTWVWFNPDNHIVSMSSQDIGLQGLSGHLELWNSLSDNWVPSLGTSWETEKKAGIWNVNVLWINTGGVLGAQNVQFTVTPEPVSSVLFLVGGTAIALRKVKYHQKTSRSGK